MRSDIAVNRTKLVTVLADKYMPKLIQVSTRHKNLYPRLNNQKSIPDYFCRFHTNNINLHTTSLALGGL